jgi:hypothetical protein
VSVGKTSRLRTLFAGGKIPTHEQGLEEGIHELVRRSRELTQPSMKLAAQTQTLIRRYQTAKLELENRWVYLLITISVTAFIYIAGTR